MTVMPPTLASLWHGRTDWPAVTAWCGAQIQRQAWLGLGALWGAAMVFWVFSEVWEAHSEADQKRAAAQTQWIAQGAVVTVPEALDPVRDSAVALWSRLPGRWPPDAAAALRQFLISERLQVLALRALPDVSAGPLKGQSLAIRMTGAYADWARAWQSLSASGPVMTIDRMSVLSMPPPSGVQIEVVLHLWSRPGSSFELEWPSERPVTVVHAGVDIFASSAGADLPPLASEAKANDPIAQSDDPYTWPVERIRWLGSWQQGAEKRAVLSAGGAWTTVRVGQRVSREGHKVQAIEADGLVLRAPQGQRLELKGGER